MESPIKTPVKTFSSTFFVPDKIVCVTCQSKHDRNSMFIFSKTGEHRSAYNTFHRFFRDFPLAEVEANWHTFLCRPCKRMLETWKQMKDKITEIEKSVMNKGQILLPYEQEKRGLRSPCTPETTPTNQVKKASKKLCFDLSSDGKSKVPSSRMKLMYQDELGLMRIDETSIMCEPLCSTPAMTQPFRLELSLITPNDSSAALSGSSVLTPNESNTIQQISSVTDSIPKSLISSSALLVPLQKKNSLAHSAKPKIRREEICYRSSALMNKQSPIVNCLASGSIWKATNLIYSSYPEVVEKLINSIILKEVKKFQKLEFSSVLRANSPSELLSFTLKNVRDEVKLHAPTLWAVLCTAGKKKSGILQLQRVTTAGLMLLNTRSSHLNSMQYASAILAHQHCLQKEGIEFLSHVGLSVSPISLNRKLNAAVEINETIMQQWKLALEQQNQIIHTREGDHDYAGPTCAIPVDNANSATALHPAFCLVLDNLDVEIRARNMTMENRDRSIHYVQVMAVQDRVNVEALPLTLDPNHVRLSQLNNSHFLPSPDDIRSMREDFIHAVSLILIEHLPLFQNTFAGVVAPGFTHQYSDVMSKKSVVIPLGIWDKSENVTHEMTEIMEDLQKLVPGVRPREALEEEIDRDPTNGRMRPIPVGGDQVSGERGRAVHRSCVEHDTPEERLEGLFCMIEDFHEKMNYVELITQKYYTKDSVMEGGTLFQLKTLINRTNMTTDVRQHFHAASDFIDLITEGHVMAAAMDFLQMETAKSLPNIFPENLTNQSKEERAAYLKEVVGKIVDRYIYHKLGEDVYRLHAHMNTNGTDQEDRIFNHASALMTHGLIRKVTKMTTAAGDGERAVRNWKYALLAYNTTNKVKYRLEAFLLLASVTCLLPPRLREQVKWCRFVNITGGQFKNVDGDEAMEMLNNAAKKQIKNLGPNHSPEVVNRIGKTVKFTNDMARDLAWQVGGACNSRERTTPSLEKDRANIVEQLTQTSKVFQYTPGREHATFRQQPSTIYGGIQAAQLHGWLSNRKKEYDQGKWAF